MARPKSDNPKSQKFTIRLTADELAQVEAMAEAAGCDRSSFARECLLKGQVTYRKPLPEIRAKTYSQLGRIGGLLNQYMKAINSGLDANVPKQLIADLIDELKLLREQLWQRQD
jgi:hypothetical protein